MRALILYPLTLFFIFCGILCFPIVLLFRPIHRRWGAIKKEVNTKMDGDDEILDASYQTTRAVSIDAGVQKVWPWIVQMGYRRAGWYGYDQFDNDGIPSATKLLPEFQNLQIGQVIGEEGLAVRSVQPNDSLVLSFSYPKPIWVFKEGIWPKFGSSSLEYKLNPIDADHTRLIIRMRFKLKILELTTLWWPFFEIGDFLNASKQLMGIKKRVESS
jgi:hypothetical protein